MRALHTTSWPLCVKYDLCSCTHSYFQARPPIIDEENEDLADIKMVDGDVNIGEEHSKSQI
jgi:hypothetical protein